MSQKQSKPLSKKATLAVAILWSVAAGLGLTRLILDLTWSKGTTLSVLLPFLDVMVSVLFLNSATRYWRLFANYKENNE